MSSRLLPNQLGHCACTQQVDNACTAAVES